MFKYKYIEDVATGEKYWIDKAALVNDDGPCADGGEWYEIDLQPVDPDGKVIAGLDLIDYGDGEVHVTKNLNPRKRVEPSGEDGRYRAVAVLATVEGDTLKVGDDAGQCKGWRPEEADRMGIIRELWFSYSNMMEGAARSNNDCHDEERHCREFIDRVMEEPLAALKDEIQARFIWLWSLWDKSIEDVASEDPERAALYQKVLELPRRDEDERSGKQSVEYFDNMADAVKALTNAWDAIGVTPKEQVLRLQRAFPEVLPELPPEAFPMGVAR